MHAGKADGHATHVVAAVERQGRHEHREQPPALPHRDQRVDIDRDGKSIKVLVDYAGNTPEAFRNPAKGKELALKQIGQGADVIYHASGGTGAGVIAAAAAEKKYVIGVDSDQSLTASPEEQKWILTSMLKRVDNAVQQNIDSYVASGSLKGGIQTLGLKEGGIDYAKNEFNTELLGDIPTTLDDLKQKIINGEITVPDKPA